MTELNRRPLRHTDVDACVQLLAAAEVVDRTGEHIDADDLAHDLADPGIDADRDTLGLFDGERLVGYAMVSGAAQPVGSHHVHLTGVVDPEHRRRGVGRELLGWQLERAATLHAQRYPELPGQLGMWVPDRVTGAAALARSAGLSQVRHWFEMECELAGVGAEPPARPSGIRTVPFDTVPDDAVRLARNDAFAEHYGSSPRTAAEWRQLFVGKPTFRPELSLITVVGDLVTGCLLSYVYPADFAATGIREAWVGTLGTRSAYRGRGIASALLRDAMACYAAAGYRRAALGVDAANATGALGLYERNGFRTVRTTSTWARTIASAPTT